MCFIFDFFLCYQNGWILTFDIFNRLNMHRQVMPRQATTRHVKLRQTRPSQVKPRQAPLKLCWTFKRNNFLKNCVLIKPNFNMFFFFFTGDVTKFRRSPMDGSDHFDRVGHGSQTLTQGTRLCPNLRPLSKGHISTWHWKR